MKRRPLFAWWRFAEDVAASLTSPRTDVATADDDVRAAVRRSRLFTASETLAGDVERSWRASLSRQVVERASSSWYSWLPAVRVRAVGACIAIAMATTLLLETLESSLDGPLRWILPVAVGLIGIAIAIAAEPIARLGGDRRT
jgi:hypothetical protein